LQKVIERFSYSKTAALSPKQIANHIRGESMTHFTNEDLARKFGNNFKLVTYAISLAENMIKSGREARVKGKDTQNRAMLILAEIREGKDQFDEIVADEPKVDRDYNEYRKHDNEREPKSDFKRNVPLDVDRKSY